MKRLTMLLVFVAIGAVVAGGYWYWQQSQGTATAATAGGGAKGKSGKAGRGGGGTLVVKAVRAVAKPMPVLIDAVGTVEPEQSVQVRAQVSGGSVSRCVFEGKGTKVEGGADPVSG